MKENNLIISVKKFKKKISEAKKIVLVDFFATWCGPCKTLSSVIDKVEKLYKEKIYVLKIDVDLNSDLSNKYFVKNVPTLLFFYKNELFLKKIGSISEEELKKILEKYLHQFQK